MQHYFKYPKKFTWKAFNKFDWGKQEILTARYDIILTDYETRNEKIVRILKKFNRKNLNKGITKFNKGMSQFNTMIAPEKPQRTRKSKPRREIVYREPKMPEPELNIWAKWPTREV